jgi:zinc transport system ATP-binding protein
MPSTDPILKVENLTVYQGNHAAAEGISFELLPGTDTAIVGPNGAGKSSLVQAILGLIPAKGEVQIFGRPLARLGNLRQQIGYIPQNFVFDRNFPLSVAELVGLGWFKQRNFFSWKPDPQKAAAIARALEQVGSYHLRHQPIGFLSGGELKRVLLAYCLVTPRRLLVLDEAFAGIDVQGETEFYTLLNQLRQNHHWTVLQISHDLDMVSAHCDRVLCLNRTLICQGRPDTALSPENLLNAYGPAFSRYQHQH